MVVPRDISEQRLDYVHWDMDGNQMFRYPMDIQEMGCATWDASKYSDHIEYHLLIGDANMSQKHNIYVCDRV